MDTPLPVIEATRDGNINGAIAGIVLAAGTSSRFGTENKLLAEIDEIPIVQRAVDILVASTVDPVVVVIGHDAPQVERALIDLPVETVRNPAYEHGQATSVATGIDALPDRIDAAVIALGDMPFVDPETVDALVATYQTGSKTALAAAYQGIRGNPVLFDANLFDDLTNVSGDSGGRHVLLGNDRSALVETADPGVIRDVDVPEDLDE